MDQDLSGDGGAEARPRAELRVHRARLAGAALIGLAALAWWLARALGIW